MLLIFQCPNSERGGFLWPDGTGGRHDRPVPPGIAQVLLCQHWHRLPPDHAGSHAPRQGAVPVPLLPGLQPAARVTL